MQSESPKQQNKAPPKAYNGGPAFPLPDSPGFEAWDGMSLRDYFAAQALIGELASLATAEGCFATIKAAEKAGREIHDQIAFSCYELADAMIKARG